MPVSLRSYLFYYHYSPLVASEKLITGLLLIVVIFACAAGCATAPSDNATRTVAPITGVATGTPAPTQADNQTIVQMAAGDPNLSTLVTAVKAAGLVETLNGTGPPSVVTPGAVPSSTYTQLSEAERSGHDLEPSLSLCPAAEDAPEWRALVSLKSWEKVWKPGTRGIQVFLCPMGLTTTLQLSRRPESSGSSSRVSQTAFGFWTAIRKISTSPRSGMIGMSTSFWMT